MIYLKLFLTFFEIGAVSFGGGYGMLSLMRELTLGHGWLTEDQLLNFIAVAESTPGPIAINMATFIGSTQGGVLGSVVATVGVVFPAFLIMLTIVSVFSGLMKTAPVGAAMTGIRPTVVGMILATSLTLGLSTLLGVSKWGSKLAVDWRGLVILALIVVIAQGCQRVLKKKISPILLILISAVFGAVLYSL